MVSLRNYEKNPLQIHDKIFNYFLFFSIYNFFNQFFSFIIILQVFLIV